MRTLATVHNLVCPVICYAAVQGKLYNSEKACFKICVAMTVARDSGKNIGLNVFSFCIGKWLYIQGGLGERRFNIW